MIKHHEFTDLINTWKVLEYENCILSEHIEDMNLNGDNLDN